MTEDGIQFESVKPLGYREEEPVDTEKLDLIDVVRREADYLRGKTDAYLELLGLLKGKSVDHEQETD